MGIFVFENDANVSYGKKEVMVEFKFDPSVTSKEELESEGFEVKGQVASKKVECETATYTFNKLPQDLEDIKKIPLDREFGPMAASICAIALYTRDKKVSIQTVDYKTWEINECFEYLNGPACEIANVDKQNTVNVLNNAFGYNTNSVSGGAYEYFDGANNTNEYTPDTPYTFTLYIGPYYIKAKAQTIANPGGEPEKHMVFASPEGDDSDRYIDVYKSGDGNWYSWDTSFKHLIAGMKGSVKAW